MDKKLLEEGSEISIEFEKRGGLIPAIVQDVKDGRVLMLAYVNAEAFETTLQKGMATFWSTSRNELWTKGETSGDFLKIVEILTDCDQDALIYVVEPQGGGSWHTKNPATGKTRETCFYRKLDLTSKTLIAAD